MAGLSRSVLQARPDVFRLQIRIILKNFLLGQACSQQIEYVLDANAHTADTRPAPTLLGIESDSVELGHVKCAHWSMNQSANLFQRLQQQQWSQNVARTRALTTELCLKLRLGRRYGARLDAIQWWGLGPG